MLTHYFLHSIAALLPNLQSGKSHLTDQFLPYHRNHSLALLYPKQLLLPSVAIAAVPAAAVTIA